MARLALLGRTCRILEDTGRDRTDRGVNAVVSLLKDTFPWALDICQTPPSAAGMGDGDDRRIPCVLVTRTPCASSRRSETSGSCRWMMTSRGLSRLFLRGLCGKR